MKKGVIFSIMALAVVVLVCLIGLDGVFAVTNVSECDTLTIENETYELNISLSSSFGCLIVNATNITLDCYGYDITYGNASGGWGIAVVDQDADGISFDNVTIKNCIVIQNEPGANESAIYFGGYANNSVAYNNTIIVYGNETAGIFFEGNSVNANITSNNVTTSGDDSNGVGIGDNSVNANIILNNITTSGNQSHGIVLFEEGSGANISSNNVTTSGEDSSGIRMNDASSSSLIFNNTIVNSGNRSLLLMGGVLLDQETSEINVSSNNITTSGYDVAAIWVSGDNSTVENNVLTSSGEVGDGIYLNTVQGINITSNTINILGNIGYGIHSDMSENSPLTFHNNLIITSGNYSYGISINQDSYNNISLNNITTSGIYSHGIYSIQSHNTTISDNRIVTSLSSSYVLYFNTSSSGNIYNNLFNTSTNDSGVSLVDCDINYFNTTKTPGTNIVGKNYIGGNFYTNSSGTGYSDICTESDGDYICDVAFRIVEGNDIYDNLPLTNQTNVLSACGTLGTENKSYYLNQSVSSEGTCFDIVASGITLDFNGYNITGNTTGYGINIIGYNDTTIEDGFIYNFSTGIYLKDNQDNSITNITINESGINGVYINASSNNAFNNININNSGQDAIVLEGTISDNNNFTAVVVTNTNFSYYDINFSTEGINGTWIIGIDNFANYSFVGAGGKVNFKEPSYGEIKFIEAINGTGISLATDIDIESNFIFINSSNNLGLNKSANIILYSITYTDPRPQFSSDGIIFTNCTTITNPSCNELSFSGNTFVFNTSHFTTFRAAEAYSVPPTPPGGGGGGGGTTIQNTTNITNQTQVNVSIGNMTLNDTLKPGRDLLKHGKFGKGEVKNFLFWGQNHSIKVIEISETSPGMYSIIIEIKSEPITLTLDIGETKQVDLNQDGINDISVIFESMEEGKVILNVNELVSIETPGPESSKAKNLTWLWLGICIVLVAVFAVIAIVLTKKKNLYSKGDNYKKKRRY